jgi:hypothetical protein
MTEIQILWSKVGIATGYGLSGRGSIPGRDNIFLHSAQTGAGVHPASYPMGNGVLSLGEGKAAGA